MLKSQKAGTSRRSKGAVIDMLSENLKNLRKEKGMSQEELASRVFVVRQTVSKWEKGLSVPDADALEKLAEVLEVPVSKLLGAPVEQPQNQNELAEQLSRLNEQLVIQNRYKEQSRKTVRTIFTVIGVIVAAGFIVILLCFILIMLLRVQSPQGPVSEQNTACISMEESFEDGPYAVTVFQP